MRNSCRHCEEQSDEAIQASASVDMDCFAEPVIGPRFVTAFLEHQFRL